MPVVTTERRSAPRTQVGLPVLVDGHECSLQQLSPRGLLVHSPVPHTVGARARLELRFRGDDGRRETVVLAGDVLRVQYQEGTWLVALRLPEAVF